MKRYNVIFDIRNFLVNRDKNAQFFLLTYLIGTQFSCTDTDNFCDKSMSFNILCSIYTEIDKFPDDLSFFTR